MESEEGVGTFTVIRVPIQAMGTGRRDETDES